MHQPVLQQAQEIVNELSRREKALADFRSREVKHTIEGIRKREDICWLKDSEGRMMSISRGYCHRLGIAYEDYVGNFDLEFHGEQGDHYQDADRAARLHETAFVITEQWVSANGTAERGDVLKMSQRMANGEIWTFGYIFQATIQVVPNG